MTVTSRVAIFRRYSAPWRNGSWLSQIRRPRNTLVRIGGLSGRLAISPRSMKICSSRVSPTDSPAWAWSAAAGRLQPSIELMCAVLPLGENSSRSPIAIRPLSIRPAMIRRSSNLYMSCTGRRSGSSTGRGAGRKLSSASIKVGPSYHGMVAARLTRFSPSRAEIGTTKSALAPKPDRYSV